MKNSVPKGFLERYKYGNVNEFVFLKLERGFLMIEYQKGLLATLSFVLEESKDSPVIGSQLLLSFSESGECTYISPEGVVGLAWSNGKVIWGSTYEDIDGKDVKEISLADWVDEIIDTMINQSDNI